MENKRPLLSGGDRRHLKDLMEHFGVKASYDELMDAHSISYVPGVPGRAYKGLIAYCKMICRNYDIPVTIVDEQIDSIIEDTVTNPVRDWLGSIKRTKDNNPVHELVDNLPIEEKRWAKVALYRWLIQCCAAADIAMHEGRHPKSLPKFESVLVLGGASGLHKSSFIKYLLPEDLHHYVKDSVVLDLKDSNSVLNVVRCWIPELGELGSALKKKAMPAMREFLSREYDEIRLTYQRESIIQRRHISCMTSVEGPYPPEGTMWDRRFLPIIATDVLDFPREAKFDYTDLWAFVWDAYTHGGQWWLTPEEEALRAEILGYPDNRSFKEMILDVFAFFDAETGEALSNRTVKMTNSEIIEKLPRSILTNRTNQFAVKAVLRDLKVKHKRRTYLMPPLIKAESPVH